LSLENEAASQLSVGMRMIDSQISAPSAPATSQHQGQPRATPKAA